MKNNPGLKSVLFFVVVVLVVLWAGWYKQEHPYHPWTGGEPKGYVWKTDIRSIGIAYTAVLGVKEGRKYWLEANKFDGKRVLTDSALKGILMDMANRTAIPPYSDRDVSYFSVNREKDVTIILTNDIRILRDCEVHIFGEGGDLDITGSITEVGTDRLNSGLLVTYMELRQSEDLVKFIASSRQDDPARGITVCGYPKKQ